MMQVVEYKKTYQEYKAELDAELNQTAEGFVRIGYLLKVARDTDILRESGYPSVTEFAKAEYGIDKTQVSRFIHINDKFAQGGYSDHLQDQYQGFGYAKLTLMLQLPDAVNESLSPTYSKAEIQTIKEEVDAENQVTDLERMMETVPMPTPREARENTLNAAIYQLGEDEPELYAEMAAVQNIRELQEAMAPAGEKTYSIRIPGTGRIMLMLSDSSEDVRLVNIRTGEKDTASWEEMFAAWQQLLDGDGSPEHWEKTYRKVYPKKEPVAPVQQTTEKSKKVVKAKPEKEKNRINTKSETPTALPKAPREEPIKQPETVHEAKALPEIPINIKETEEKEPAETASENPKNAEKTKYEARWEKAIKKEPNIQMIRESLIKNLKDVLDAITEYQFEKAAYNAQGIEQRIKNLAGCVDRVTRE